MYGNPVPCEPLHIWHWCIAVEVGFVVDFLLQNIESTYGRFFAFFTGRDRAENNQLVVLEYIDPLRIKHDDNFHRPLIAVLWNPHILPGLKPIHWSLFWDGLWRRRNDGWFDYRRDHNRRHHRAFRDDSRASRYVRRHNWRGVLRNDSTGRAREQRKRTHDVQYPDARVQLHGIAFEPPGYSNTLDRPNSSKEWR